MPFRLKSDARTPLAPKRSRLTTTLIFIALRWLREQLLADLLDVSASTRETGRRTLRYRNAWVKALGPLSIRAPQRVVSGALRPSCSLLSFHRSWIPPTGKIIIGATVNNGAFPKPSGSR